MEFAGWKMWRNSFLFPKFTKVQVIVDKPLEPAVHQVFIPTALMVSFTLALLVTILVTVDVWKVSEAVGRTFYVTLGLYKIPSKISMSFKTFRILPLAKAGMC